MECLSLRQMKPNTLRNGRFSNARHPKDRSEPVLDDRRNYFLHFTLPADELGYFGDLEGISRLLLDLLLFSLAERAEHAAVVLLLDHLFRPLLRLSQIERGSELKVVTFWDQWHL